MEHLNGPFLFDSMYAEDVEGNKLACLHGAGELLEAYPFWATVASVARPGPHGPCLPAASPFPLWALVSPAVFEPLGGETSTLEQAEPGPQSYTESGTWLTEGPWSPSPQGLGLVLDKLGQKFGRSVCLGH